MRWIRYDIRIALFKMQHYTGNAYFPSDFANKGNKEVCFNSRFTTTELVTIYWLIQVDFKSTKINQNYGPLYVYLQQYIWLS